MKIINKSFAYIEKNIYLSIILNKTLRKMTTLRKQLQESLSDFNYWNSISVYGMTNTEIDKAWKKQDNARYNLIHTYRLIIANGDLSDRKYMDEIEIFITKNGNAKVIFRGVLMGFYGKFNELFELRNTIDSYLEKDWFKKELEII